MLQLARAHPGVIAPHLAHFGTDSLRFARLRLLSLHLLVMRLSADAAPFTERFDRGGSFDSLFQRFGLFDDLASTFFFKSKPWSRSATSTIA